jgi:hypothetical protein
VSTTTLMVATSRGLAVVTSLPDTALIMRAKNPARLPGPACARMPG